MARRPPWELILFKGEESAKCVRRVKASAAMRDRAPWLGGVPLPYSRFLCFAFFILSLSGARVSGALVWCGACASLAWPFSGGLETAGEHWLSFPLPPASGARGRRAPLRHRPPGFVRACVCVYVCCVGCPERARARLRRHHAAAARGNSRERRGFDFFSAVAGTPAPRG